MKKYEKYIERNDLQGASHLEISVYYTKGGANYFSGGTTPRGYYISVKPVTKRDGTISFALFSGRGKLLLETSRYSDKQFAKAIELSKGVEGKLIEAVLSECKAA